MGRAAVRAAVSEYLAAADLPYTGTVFATRPEIINEDDYELSMVSQLAQYVVSSEGSGAIVIVNLTDSNRHRKALSGVGFVSDWTIHDVELEVLLANVAGDAASAQTDMDTLADAMVTAIRADPNLAAPGVVWSAGELPTSVTVRQSPPYTGSDTGMTVFIVSLIRLQVYEDVESPAGAA